MPKSKLMIVIIFAQLGQIISLVSNSFIEEEYLVWYFYTTTILVFILYQFITTTKNLYSLETVQCILEWSILLVLNSIVREMNITYVDIQPNNISLWLNQHSHITALSAIFVAGK